MIVYICIVIDIDVQKIQEWHDAAKEATLHGRRITIDHIEPLIHKLPDDYIVERIGNSTLQKPIYSITIGNGATNILIWSQMHGNESTGTKAVFDLLNFLEQPNSFTNLRDQILANCRITFVPMLNPDGATQYTRVNAEKIDLNRDVLDQKAAESKILLAVLHQVNPTYCFNLHDQRTLFTVGDTQDTATLSFLAPSEDKERTVTNGRKETMKVIVSMNNLLQKIIPGNIGRYTDEFYPTATGDNFQKMGHNTILIEAGHYKDDYTRETVRKFNFIALLEGLNFISSKLKSDVFQSYFDIPNNTKFYFDVLFLDIFIASENKKVDVGFFYKETLVDGKILFIPEVERIGNLKKFGANTIFNELGVVFADIDELQRFLKKRS